MASWVITISKDFAQHWDYARRDGVWDMAKNFRVRDGDVVYFRIAGGPLIGQTVATSDARPLTSGDVVPWDDGRDAYTTRFTFRLLSDAPVATPSWGVVAARLSKRPALQVPRAWTSAEDEAVLASYFDPSKLTPEQSLDDAQRERVFQDLSEDLRVRTLQLIDLRRGQPAFRRALLQAYNGTCAVTGTAMERVLEAAHIAPYKGAHTNDVTNGLLLRADIHTLFDLHLLTVTEEHIVRVAPDVGEPEYERLDGQSLATTPQVLADLPAADQLVRHNAVCSWLAPPDLSS